MGITKTEFGKMQDGTVIYKYTIDNKNGMKASVINYGAILTDLLVPDEKGEVADVVLGYDTLEPYYENGSFFGATVGPNANRTANASFVLNGVKYQLDVNDGPNNLHSHMDKGYHKRVYKAVEGDNSVTFSLSDNDGNMGFPGNKEICVTYALSDDNELSIHYEATSDKDTIINMTNHSYFNLKGHDQGIIEDHVLYIDADRYTPVIPGAIPTGELADVKGTVFDFTSPMEVGAHVNDDVEQLVMVKGYDHNFVLTTPAGEVRKIAEVTVPGVTRKMEVFTDLPAVQFYAGNCISETVGKNGTVYGARSGLCLETQYNPDTANRPEWPSAVYGPSRKYDTVTIYKFS